MFILSIGTSLFEVLSLCFRKSHYLKKNVRFFYSFVDSCIGTICHHKDFIGRVLLGKTLFHPETTYFTHKEDFFLARYRSPNGPHWLWMVQPIRSPENPGTTVVSIGHLTPWHENPGYRTQVWDNANNRIALIYDRRLGSSAAETPAKYQSDQTALSCGFEISWWKEVLPLSEWRPRIP